MMMHDSFRYFLYMLMFICTNLGSAIRCKDILVKSHKNGFYKSGYRYRHLQYLHGAQRTLWFIKLSHILERITNNKSMRGCATYHSYD